MRKEKYIYENIYKKKLTGFNVVIRIKGQKSVFKFISIDEYGSKNDAMEAARMIRDKELADIRMGKHLDGKILTVGELYERKFELLPCTLKTKERQDSIYRHSVIDYKDKLITEITIADVQNSLNKYSETHDHNRTSHLMAIWRQIYRAAVMDGIDVSDKTVAAFVPKDIRVVVHRSVDLSDKDLQTFMETLKIYNQFTEQGRWRSQCIWYMCYIAYYTGMQPAEILALEWKDIHDDFIDVYKCVGSTKTKKRQIKVTKNGYRIRHIPIDELKPILDDWHQINTFNYVICNDDGSLIEIDDLTRYINYVAKKAGVEFNLYRLRHKFSTDMYRNKVNPRVIKDLMGHATENMSLYYATSDEQDAKKAIKGRS
jgi:integrase